MFQFNSEKDAGVTMPHVQSELINVKKVRKKGRGVFARTNIAKGTIIERVPVIVVPVQEVFGQRSKTKLADYVFKWSNDTVAVALGYGSLYNHSYRPSANYYFEGSQTQVFVAIRDIDSGEEITVNYNGDPKSRKGVGFDVVES